MLDTSNLVGESQFSRNCPVNLQWPMQELVRHFNGGVLAVDVVMLLLPARVV